MGLILVPGAAVNASGAPTRATTFPGDTIAPAQNSPVAGRVGFLQQEPSLCALSEQLIPPNSHRGPWLSEPTIQLAVLRVERTRQLLERRYDLVIGSLAGEFPRQFRPVCPAPSEGSR